ncbi:hypothetical protein O6P43_018096 [Quillaja saponaria]|uniref:Uncharacterized protein n=1 Tax=Quillaja saponaria TaxID=32244 RepID=A0AAD7LT72_QUISA|nr:hypothetical protein O6P43_018096 [Quillaja saponaria]
METFSPLKRHLNHGILCSSNQSLQGIEVHAATQEMFTLLYFGEVLDNRVVEDVRSGEANDWAISCIMVLYRQKMHLEAVSSVQPDGPPLNLVEPVANQSSVAGIEAQLVDGNTRAPNDGPEQHMELSSVHGKSLMEASLINKIRFALMATVTWGEKLISPAKVDGKTYFEGQIIMSQMNTKNFLSWRLFTEGKVCRNSVVIS